MTLTAEQTLAIIQDENLERGLWFADPTNEVDVVGIGRDGDGWVVYTTDERATIHGAEHFDDESAALASFLDRLRALNRALAYQRRRAQARRGDR